jgi:hypothetical protein
VGVNVVEVVAVKVKVKVKVKVPPTSLSGFTGFQEVKAPVSSRYSAL